MLQKNSCWKFDRRRDFRSRIPPEKKPKDKRTVMEVTLMEREIKPLPPEGKNMTSYKIYWFCNVSKYWELCTEVYNRDAAHRTMKELREDGLSIRLEKTETIYEYWQDTEEEHIGY